MMQTDKDPIVAIATASGRGAIGIVRLSFDEQWNDKILTTLFPDQKIQPRHAHLLPIQDARGNTLDHGIVLFFPCPHSYTGESVLEIQVHGGTVLLQMVLQNVLQQCAEIGMRMARAGEFTERAFMNGRLDLAQAEAVADLIDATSTSAAYAATRSLTGEFSKRVSVIGNELNELRAYIEAILDFPEEELDNLRIGRIFERLEHLQSRLITLISQAHQGKILREGLNIALVGRPNVGKSSLMNYLAGDEVAIVTDIAGTTRDRIEHWVSLNGIPLCLIDTAGVRETEDIVEKKGIERTFQAIAKADIVLHLVDATGTIDDGSAVLERVLQHTRSDVKLLTIANKIDLNPSYQCRPNELGISVRTGRGIRALQATLLRLVGMTSSPEGLFMARERHMQCLQKASHHVLQAVELSHCGGGLELLAEELRCAGIAMGEILGEVSSDDILGMIFSKFCIGK